MSLAILGIGTAVPPHRSTQEESVAVARSLAGADGDRAEILAELYRQTEIKSRHLVLSQTAVQDLIDGTDVSGTGFCSTGPDDRGPDTAQRMAGYMAEALPMACQAGRKALEESGLSPAAITHLVTVSCTGFAAPGFDIGLIKALELAPTVARTHVGFMGCHGAFNG